MNNCDWCEFFIDSLVDKEVVQCVLEFFFVWFVDFVYFGYYF